jgi:hypothetical protein
MESFNWAGRVSTGETCAPVSRSLCSRSPTQAERLRALVGALAAPFLGPLPVGG